MKTKQIIKQAHKLSGPLRIKNGGKCRLKDVDPGDTLELKDEDKPRAKEALAWGIELLAELQDKLYAQDKRAVLLIFQADGRRWQGRHPQARHVGDKSAGLQGDVLQGAELRRS
jgi:hypothetical protein